jgi:hypothetical protein
MAQQDVVIVAGASGFIGSALITTEKQTMEHGHADTERWLRTGR